MYKAVMREENPVTQCGAGVMQNNEVGTVGQRPRGQTQGGREGTRREAE